MKIRLPQLFFLSALVLARSSLALASACQDSGTLAVTHGSTSAYVYGQGSGCLARPIQDVWSALKEKATMSFEGSTLIASTLTPEPTAGATFTYENQYKAGGVFAVTWVMRWDHAVVSGTEAAPTSVEVRYAKISGTSYIGYWQGTITLDSLGPDATAVALENQISAAQTSETDAAATVQQLFDKLK